MSKKIPYSPVSLSDFPLLDYKPRSVKGAFLSFFGMIGLAIVAGGVVAAATLPIVPISNTATDQVNQVLQAEPSENIVLGQLMERSNIYAKGPDGSNVLLASFFDQDRQEVGWDQVNNFAKDAAIAAEDTRFYEHSGVDYQGVARAALSNAFGKNLQGGSSITQQLVKNTLVQQAEAIPNQAESEAAYAKATETSFSRKAAEMRMAMQLEKQYTKDEILLGYLNIVGFGGRIYGIESAAQYYYGVPAINLTLDQAATLIGTVNDPNNLRIDRPDSELNGAANGYAEAKKRRDYVLLALKNTGKITKDQYDQAVAAPITPNITQPSTGCTTAGTAAYFCDYVTTIVQNDPAFGETPEARANLLKRGGLQIYTTLDMQLQDVEQSVTNEYVPHVMEGVDLGSATVSIQPGTGRVLAMAQNKDYTNDPDIAATGPNFTSINYNTDYAHGGSTGFPVGSTYKLFTLLEWLNSGHSLGESFNGNVRTYTSFANSCQGDWTGSYRGNNDGGGGGGYMNAFRATTGSVNSGYLAMANQLDMCGITSMADKFRAFRADGEPLNQSPFSVLGSNEIPGLNMAVAYAGVAANGLVCSPVAIDKVTNADGVDLPIPAANCEQKLDPGTAGAAAQALQAVIESGTATQSFIGDGVPVIGKTGTTDDSIHTWMIGGSTKVVTATWVGNVTGFTPMRGISINGWNGGVIRHEIWRNVQAFANSKYGGDNFAQPNPDLGY